MVNGILKFFAFEDPPKKSIKNQCQTHRTARDTIIAFFAGSISNVKMFLRKGSGWGEHEDG